MCPVLGGCRGWRGLAMMSMSAMKSVHALLAGQAMLAGMAVAAGSPRVVGGRSARVAAARIEAASNGRPRCVQRGRLKSGRRLRRHKEGAPTCNTWSTGEHAAALGVADDVRRRAAGAIGRRLRSPGDEGGLEGPGVAPHERSPKPGNPVDRTADAGGEPSHGSCRGRRPTMELRKARETSGG